MKKIFLTFLFLLHGCANAPVTQFYSLEAMAVSQTISAKIENKPLVGISQISLPSALERKQIVTRDSKGQLQLHEQHQWAALLKQNMTEVMAKNLAFQQPHVWFKAYPWSLLGKVDYRLVIDVTRLDIILGKKIDFSVDWTLLNEKNHIILQHNTIDLAFPLTDENVATAISGLNLLLTQLSEKLALNLHILENQK